jgi:type IV secretory pathway ATPase VirB11/archaellum biosynthesis ATPase
MSLIQTHSALTNELLMNALKPFRRYYDSPEVEEIAINRPGEIYVKPLGGNWQPSEAPEISIKLLHALCRMLANITEQDFDPNALPILSATLPGGHRFQAVIGPNVRYDMSDTHGVAINIRRFDKNKKFQLEDFNLRPGEKIEAHADTHRGLHKRRYSEFIYEDLVQAVANGEAVLISGATSTGKTTFLNALVEHIPLHNRLITVEDTREVMVRHQNRVHFVVSRTAAANKVTYAHVLDAIVRMTPDAIICGEISITNAKSIYRLMTTGHSNFMATIHADSPEMALRAFWQNLAQTDPEIDPHAVIEILTRSFGRIVQIDRRSGKRVITAVDAPNIVEKVMKEIQQEEASLSADERRARQRAAERNAEIQQS